MNTDVDQSDHPASDGPLQDFSSCHVGILKHLEGLRRLPGLVARPDGMAEARGLATDLMDFFPKVVVQHHAEEEEELFTAVLQSAEGPEASQAAAQVEQLVAEHRRLEAMWGRMAPAIGQLARGEPAALEATEVEALVVAYGDHAHFEETEFLPLSARVLSKNHQSALGLSLHMRHGTNPPRPSLGITPWKTLPVFWEQLLRFTLGVVAAALLLAMMTLTSVDVIGRYLFNRPLAGAFEVTELMLAALIFVGLPLATARDEHITVDLLDALLPAWLIQFGSILMSVLSALVLGGVAWQLWLKTRSLVEDDTVTHVLEVPLAPIGYLMVLGCVLSGLILLAQAVLMAGSVFGRSTGDAR